jgi:hypothetical protein
MGRAATRCPLPAAGYRPQPLGHPSDLDSPRYQANRLAATLQLRLEHLTRLQRLLPNRLEGVSKLSAMF